MTPDQEYKRLVQDVISNGIERNDRTGIGTLSVFGRSMRFNLQDGFPLLTTKRVYFKGVVEELLWMIKGCTDANDLAKEGVHIWDANGSRKFLDDIGLEYPTGTLGPIYGHQWRHFNAEYKGSQHDYSGCGFDQLKWIIDEIRKNPTSRRLIMSAWNPAQNHLMALPACHTMCQFYVDTSNNRLSCQLYQRSGDIGLGVPFNIASYALLTHMIAATTGTQPWELVHVIGDAHIYKNHIDALKNQIKCEEYPSPTLSVTKHLDIDKYTKDDVSVIGYKCNSGIKMDMAV